ncbi:MAG: hypothetical protein M3323_04850 [Actinomycetota bacterium]|nr:hypothetical protein [Actinomycetota bacterium]
MRRKRTTFVLAGLAFGALVTGAVVAPAAARSPLERVTLGEVNVVSGDHIAGMEVHVPRDATIEADPFSNDDVSYSGDGRVVGVVLVEEGPRAGRAFQLVSVRWAFCGAPGCRPERHDVTELTTTSSWRGKRWRIPAGDYRLYLVTDGAPATVTLRLAGLEGRTALHPNARVAGRIAAPTATAAATPTDHLFLGRARPMVMPADGLLIDGGTTDYGLGPSAGTQGACFWRGRGEEDLEQQIPGPHCREFAERGGWSYSTTTFGGGWATWGIGTVPAGKWRSSYYAANAAAVPESDFVTLWLAYEDPVR